MHNTSAKKRPKTRQFSRLNVYKWNIFERNVKHNGQLSNQSKILINDVDTIFVQMYMLAGENRPGRTAWHTIGDLKFLFRLLINIVYVVNYLCDSYRMYVTGKKA